MSEDVHDETETPAPEAEKRKPAYPPDRMLELIVENAVDPTTRLKALLYLAFQDRCIGQPVDKAEAAIFDAHMATVFTTLKLSVVKGGKD